MTSQSGVAMDSAEATKSMRSSKGSDVSSIRYFPVTMFAGILGLCGTGLAWRKAAEVFDLPFVISKLIFGFGLGYSLAVLVLYGFKLARHHHLVLEDLRHPVRGNFLPAAPLGLLLIAEVLAPQFPALASSLWMIGVAITLVLTVVILNQWIDGRYKPHEITPAWFIPSVGLLVAPVTGAPLGFYDFSWMLLAVGMIFWIALLPITLHRLFFRRPISPGFKPLFIHPGSAAGIVLHCSDPIEFGLHGRLLDDPAGRCALHLLHAVAAPAPFHWAAIWHALVGLHFPNRCSGDRKPLLF